MNQNKQARLDRVLAQLRLYEHPLLEFSARSKGDGVEVIIQFKDSAIPVHTYYFELHPRDLIIHNLNGPSSVNSTTLCTII